jgi:glycosyltransferase involved in cell wall biosynthesis
MLALLAVRDEMAYLPGWLDNVAGQVDGVVALDDGSADGSADLLESRPEVLEVLRVPRDRPAWDEPGNHRRLVAAGLRHGAEWLVCLDADERVEREFRVRAERVIRRGRLLGLSAYGVRIRSLWDSPDAIRVDGDWGRRFVPRLFRAQADHAFDDRPLHHFKAPMQARILGRYFPLADLEVYHLRMQHPADRIARRQKYERWDPDGRWQAREVGYAYLTDETGLRVRPIRPARHYAPQASAPAASPRPVTAYAPASSPGDREAG